MPNTEVERRAGRGRCLIAAKELGLGDLIMAVQPLSAVLSEDQARERCAGCFNAIRGQQDGGRGSRCSGCKSIWYCSRRCQKADWGQHRQECKAWTAQDTARTPTRTLRLAGRILNCMNGSAGKDSDGGGGSKGTGVDGEDRSNGDGGVDKASDLREAIGELVHHNEKRPPEQKEQYMLMAAFVARLCVAGGGRGKSKGNEVALSWPSAQGRGFSGLVDSAFAILGKMSCNVFSIVAGTLGGEVGCGLYLEAAAANHSCSPNASQSFDGKTLSLRCTRPIARGEEITIGITQIQRPGPVRRESLRNTYFFECRCERCESPGGRAEDARLEAYACPDGKCPGLCLAPANRDNKLVGSNGQFEEGAALQRGAQPAQSLPSEDANAADSATAVEDRGSECLVCGTCGATSRRVEEARREGESVRELLERGKAFEERGQAEAARQCLEQAAGRAKAWLHRGNWVLSELCSLLASVCVQLQDFDSATVHATDGLDSARASLGDLLPYFEPWGNSLALTGKLLLCVRRQPEKALPILLEAEASVKVTHGQQHPLYREVRDLLDQASHGR